MINRKTKILISGGSSGIGFHLVKRLLKDNYYIINLSRNKSDIKSKNLMLHAYKIKFMINNIQYNFKARYTKEFEEFLRKQF